MVLKNAMTIDEAEKQYSQITKKREKIWVITAIVGLTLGFGGLLAGILASIFIPQEELPGIVKTAVLLAATAGIANLMVSVGVVSTSPYKAIENIRAAQRAWVESHRIKLPQGAFDSLRFPLLAPADGSVVLYGVSQVVTSDGRALVSVTLEHSPESGYLLRGTDGAPLQPLKLVGNVV
jgi:hypothetical protein